MGLGKRRSDGELGEVAGDESVVRMHCMRQESIFPPQKNVKVNVKKKK